jgi:hypothetical protein
MSKICLHLIIIFNRFTIINELFYSLIEVNKLLINKITTTDFLIAEKIEQQNWRNLNIYL